MGGCWQVGAWARVAATSTRSTRRGKGSSQNGLGHSRLQSGRQAAGARGVLCLGGHWCSGPWCGSRRAVEEQLSCDFT